MRIAVIPGDGIGKDVTAEEILDSALRGSGLQVRRRFKSPDPGAASADVGLDDHGKAQALPYCRLALASPSNSTAGAACSRPTRPVTIVARA